MKIAIICDIHLPKSTHAPQYHFLRMAIERIKNDGIGTVLSLGDTSAYGEWEAFQNYSSLLDGLTHHILLGNADVRDPVTEEQWISVAAICKWHFAGKTLLGINTPYGKITPEDRKEIEELQDGDILAMHHSIRALDEDSRVFLQNLSHKRKLTILNGHSHLFQEEWLFNFHVVSLRALDPDKAIGNYPSVTYIDFSANEITLEEKYMTLSQDVVQNAAKYFGISCVDNTRDVAYAVDKNVYGIELRCNGSDWEPDVGLLPQLDQWRNHTNGYLSIHMPNVWWNDGDIQGLLQWKQATDYALTVGADGLTMHPPRVSRKDMFPGSPAWNAFLQIYVDTISRMPERTNIGIENIHLSPEESDDQNAKFGCAPQEVLAWIQAIRTALNSNHCVGHTLDVGHARNNGEIAKKYPISRWYESMGDKTVAYHIHQVVKGERTMGNHQPIEHWFGPMISYVSFFYSWGAGIINKRPVFLEVKGADHYQTSMIAFQNDFSIK